MNKLKEFREYIILIVIAAALLLFIIFRSAGNINYDLPEPEQIDYDSVSRLTIESSSINLEFTRNGDDWIIQPEGWIADTSTLKSIVTGVTDLKIADLVSSSGSASLYDLDENMRAKVEIFDSEGKSLRELFVGKTSSSGIYTYMMFPGDDNIYSVRGNLPSRISADKNSMRSKEVFKAPKDSIEKLTLQGAEGTVTLFKDESDAWQSAGGSFEADSDKVSSALSYIDPMRCTDFLDEAPAGSPEWTITVSSSEGEASIEIWPKQDNRYPVRSSQNGYSVLITSYVAENLLEAFGIEFGEK